MPKRPYTEADRAAKRRYYRKNRERLIEEKRRWKEENRERVREMSRRAYARKRAREQGNSLPPTVWEVRDVERVTRGEPVAASAARDRPLPATDVEARAQLEAAECRDRKGRPKRASRSARYAPSLAERMRLTLRGRDGV